MAKQKIALATVFALLTGLVMRQHASADSPVPCTGDASACGVLDVVQHGTDPQSGAHFIMTIAPRLDKTPQSMMLTLSIASSSDSCASAVDTYANINPEAQRSIDGYLCKLRATWERR